MHLGLCMRGKLEKGSGSQGGGGDAKGLPPQPSKVQKEDGDTRDLSRDTEAGPYTQPVHSSPVSLSSPFQSLTP